MGFLDELITPKACNGSEGELQENDRSGWRITPDGHGIERLFIFRRIGDIGLFLNSLYSEAKKKNHDPEIFIHTSFVHIIWTTHRHLKNGKKGISDLDLEMARYCNSMVRIVRKDNPRTLKSLANKLTGPAAMQIYGRFGPKPETSITESNAPIVGDQTIAMVTPKDPGPGIAESNAPILGDQAIAMGILEEDPEARLAALGVPFQQKASLFHEMTPLRHNKKTTLDLDNTALTVAETGGINPQNANIGQGLPSQETILRGMELLQEKAKAYRASGSDEHRDWLFETSRQAKVATKLWYHIEALYQSKHQSWDSLPVRLEALRSILHFLVERLRLGRDPLNPREEVMHQKTLAVERVRAMDQRQQEGLSRNSSNRKTRWLDVEPVEPSGPLFRLLPYLSPSQKTIRLDLEPMEPRILMVPHAAERNRDMDQRQQEGFVRNSSRQKPIQLDLVPEEPLIVLEPSDRGANLRIDPPLELSRHTPDQMRIRLDVEPVEHSRPLIKLLPHLRVHKTIQLNSQNVEASDFDASLRTDPPLKSYDSELSPKLQDPEMSKVTSTLLELANGLTSLEKLFASDLNPSYERDSKTKFYNYAKDHVHDRKDEEMDARREKWEEAWAAADELNMEVERHDQEANRIAASTEEWLKKRTIGYEEGLLPWENYRADYISSTAESKDGGSKITDDDQNVSWQTYDAVLQNSKAEPHDGGSKATEHEHSKISQTNIEVNEMDGKMKPKQTGSDLLENVESMDPQAQSQDAMRMSSEMEREVTEYEPSVMSQTNLEAYEVDQKTKPGEGKSNSSENVEQVELQGPSQEAEGMSMERENKNKEKVEDDRNQEVKDEPESGIVEEEKEITTRISPSTILPPPDEYLEHLMAQALDQADSFNPTRTTRSSPPSLAPSNSSFEAQRPQTLAQNSWTQIVQRAAVGGSITSEEITSTISQIRAENWTKKQKRKAGEEICYHFRKSLKETSRDFQTELRRKRRNSITSRTLLKILNLLTKFDSPGKLPPTNIRKILARASPPKFGGERKIIPSGNSSDNSSVNLSGNPNDDPSDNPSEISTGNIRTEMDLLTWYEYLLKRDEAIKRGEKVIKSWKTPPNRRERRKARRREVRRKKERKKERN